MKKLSLHDCICVTQRISWMFPVKIHYAVRPTKALTFSFWSAVA